VRNWLEKLFFGEGVECVIVLSWRDQSRRLCVLVDLGPGKRDLMREFFIEIEPLVWMNETQMVERFIRPVAMDIKAHGGGG
jgi:hypothetical protein